jgi:hypothetical protein
MVPSTEEQHKHYNIKAGIPSSTTVHKQLKNHHMWKTKTVGMT